jgi:hypothetical protein
MIEKRSEFNLETHIAFVDFEKAFDQVSRHLLWSFMKIRGYPQQIIKAIQSLYNESNIVINTGIKGTAKIKTNQALRQGCSPSSTIFNICIDDVIKNGNSINPGIKLHFYMPTI